MCWCEGSVAQRNGVDPKWLFRLDASFPPIHRHHIHDQSCHHHPLPTSYLCRPHIPMVVSQSWPSGIVLCRSLFSLFTHTKNLSIYAHRTLGRTPTLLLHAVRPFTGRSQPQWMMGMLSWNLSTLPIWPTAPLSSTHTHTDTHTHTQLSVSMYVSSNWGLQMCGDCVGLCVLHACCCDQFLLERWKAGFLCLLVCRPAVHCLCTFARLQFHAAPVQNLYEPYVLCLVTMSACVR